MNKSDQPEWVADVIQLEPNATYQLCRGICPELWHPPNIACSCLHCMAAVRLGELAEVFEEAGDHAAADAAQEWAERASRRDHMGERMARAIIEGEYSDGC